MPSQCTRFAPRRFANAWLPVPVLAHNPARWTTRIGLGEPVATTKTLRRRFFSLAGRITRKARRLTLHLPQGWPCKTSSAALSPNYAPCTPILAMSTASACPLDYPITWPTRVMPVPACLLLQSAR
ncbi:MAG: hypothetical protein OXF79_19105 [Chloroflexi bacterium]|nr:hypothetical protein [Chloroflexota bacterium]